MKITKAYLKKLIKEEIDTMDNEDGSGSLTPEQEEDIQDIVDLISDRISKVGFGDEDEEDFLAAKVELKEDLDQITFEQWQERKNKMKNYKQPERVK